MVYETWADGHWYIDIYILIYDMDGIDGHPVFQALVKTWYVDGHPIQNHPEIMGDHPSPWIDMMTIPQWRGKRDGPCCRPDMGEESEKLETA